MLPMRESQALRLVPHAEADGLTVFHGSEVPFVRVVDDTGHGVVNAVVQVQLAGQSESRDFRTDANGYASTLHAADGVYTVGLFSAPLTHLMGLVGEDGQPGLPASGYVTLDGDRPDGVVEIRVTRASTALLDLWPRTPLLNTGYPVSPRSGEPGGFGLHVDVAVEGADGSRRQWTRFGWEALESGAIQVHGLPPSSVVIGVDLYGFGATEARATLPLGEALEVAAVLDEGRCSLDLQVPTYHALEHPVGVALQSLSPAGSPVQRRIVDANRDLNGPESRTYRLSGLLPTSFVMWSAVPSSFAWGRILGPLSEGSTYVEVERPDPTLSTDLVRVWADLRPSEDDEVTATGLMAPPPRALFVPADDLHAAGRVISGSGFFDLHPGAFHVLVWSDATSLRGRGGSSFRWIRDVVVQAGTRVVLRGP